jgi:hypothetical protein
VCKGEEFKGKHVVPGLGERWDRPLEEQLGISIPDESLPAMMGRSYAASHSAKAAPLSNLIRRSSLFWLRMRM